MKLTELNPKFVRAYNNRGNVYADKGDYDRAIRDYNKALELNPDYAKAYATRGAVYYLKQDYDKAWADVKKARELGLTPLPEFIKELKKASGRNE